MTLAMTSDGGIVIFRGKGLGEVQFEQKKLYFWLYAHGYGIRPLPVDRLVLDTFDKTPPGGRPIVWVVLGTLGGMELAINRMSSDWTLHAVRRAST